LSARVIGSAPSQKALSYCQRIRSSLARIATKLSGILGGSERPNAAYIVSDCVAGIPQIDGSLRIQPKLRAISKKAR
jgi:hypothetical protein